MNKYDIAYWIVTAIGVLAFIVLVTILTVLVHRLVTISGHEQVARWLDTLMDEDAEYMEHEQERRGMYAFGDPDAKSALRYFGLRYVIERRLHVIAYAIAWRIFIFQQDHMDLYTTVTWLNGGQEDDRNYNR